MRNLDHFHIDGLLTYGIGFMKARSRLIVMGCERVSLGSAKVLGLPCC